MRLARKVEVQPTPMQVRALLQHAGNARWAYNWGLSRKKEAWDARKAALESGVPKEQAPKVPTAIDLHRELNALKKLPVEDGGVPWMYAASKAAPQEALRNLDKAFQHFFRRVKTGEKPGYPRFKSRNRGVCSFTLTGTIHVQSRFVTLPVIGRLRLKPGERGYLPAGKHGTITVTERAGRWYASILGPEVEEADHGNGDTVGLDLGIARLATLSDGTVIENPKAFASGHRALKKAQQALSRKERGSCNRQKARKKVARVHARIANVRTNHSHQVTAKLTKSHGKIVIEDLLVSNMTRAGRGKHGLNRVLLDASFGEFRRQLEYKAKLYGCEIIPVPPQYTSQTCSICGCVDAASRMSQPEFACVHCGFQVNADLNAAINILVAGSCPETLNACGEDVRPDQHRLVGQTSMKQESAVA